jgi:hypothetical protein
VESEILVELFEADADPEQLDDETRRLRRDLLELDVDSVVPASAGEAPPGTRAVDLAAIGALVVTMRGGVDLVTKVVSVVQSWLHGGARPDRTLKMTVGDNTIELTDPTDEQQQLLIDKFVQQVAAEA